MFYKVVSFYRTTKGISYQFSSVTQSCPTLCDPMNHSTPGLPVHHQLLESTQTHVCWVGDTIQLSHPLLSPSPPALNLSKHQGLFKWISSLNLVAKVLEFQLQHQSFQWISYMCTYITSLLDLPPTPCPTHIGHHKALSWGPCTIRELPTSCLFYRCVGAMSFHSCLTLCYSMDSTLPGSSVHGLLQARILEWVAVPFSRYIPHPRIEPESPALPRRFFTTKPPGKPLFYM